MTNEGLTRDAAREALLSLFRTVYSEKKAAKIAKRLLDTFGSLTKLLTASPAMLISEIGEEAALYLRLSLSLSLRKTTEALREGDAVDEAALTRHFSALYRDCGQETVYVLFTDEKGRMLSRHAVSKGSLDASSLIPRQILELAIRASARGVYLLHNHPGADLTPSSDDLRMTKSVAAALCAARIAFHGHYAFFGDEFIRIYENGTCSSPQKIQETL